MQKRRVLGAPAHVAWNTWASSWCMESPIALRDQTCGWTVAFPWHTSRVLKVFAQPSVTLCSAGYSLLLKRCATLLVLCGHGSPKSIHISMHVKTLNIHSSFCLYRAIGWGPTVHYIPVLILQVILCPVRHEKVELNGPDDFYSGLIESPFQAPHVMCRALVPDRNTMKKYEEAVYSRECDDAEERACISRVLSHMYMHM